MGILILTNGGIPSCQFQSSFIGERNIMSHLDFYRTTSLFTDLGLYEDFARSLPDNLEKLCRLQRKQIIHPVAFYVKDIRKKSDTEWGDMTQVPDGRLQYEDDLFPTAQAILHELLRRDPEYGENRQVRNKVHVTCRGQSLLLCATLKAKGYAARVRSGYAFYISNRFWADHWIVEYWNEEKKQWIFCDADIYGFSDSVDPVDIDRNQYMTGGQTWLAFRNGKVLPEDIRYAAGDTGFKAALLSVIYDFNCLMGNEMSFLHFPKAFDGYDEGSVEFISKIDSLAKLLCSPDENFEKLKAIWDNETEWKTFKGGMN